MRVTAAQKGQEVALMKRKRHTPEQIIRKLREAERLLEEEIELSRGEPLRHSCPHQQAEC